MGRKIFSHTRCQAKSRKIFLSLMLPVPVLHTHQRTQTGQFLNHSIKRTVPQASATPERTATSLPLPLPLPPSPLPPRLLTLPLRLLYEYLVLLHPYALLPFHHNSQYNQLSNHDLIQQSVLDGHMAYIAHFTPVISTQPNYTCFNFDQC